MWTRKRPKQGYSDGILELILPQKQGGTKQLPIK